MNIGTINFPIYATIVLLALVNGVIFNIIYLKYNQIDIQYIKLFSFLIFLASIVGGFLLNIFQMNNNLIQFGLSSYGGAIGVILASIIFEKIYPKDNIFIKSGVLCLPLIYAISKLACFFSGCCYGLPCDSEIFYVKYIFGLNIKLIPIQLIESIIFILIFGLCSILNKKKNIISITIVICALSKFFLDFFRYNHLNEVISKNQIISILIIFITLIVSLKTHKKNNINCRDSSNLEE